MFQISLIAALISSAYAATRHVITNYTVPLIGTTTWAYPLDVCVNWVIDGKTFTPEFGKYSCNDAKDAIILTEYGADPTCSVEPTGIKNVIDDTSLFNCDGEDSYLSFVACNRDTMDNPPTFGGPVCCQEPTTNLAIKGCLTSTLATNVCYQPNMDGNYTMHTCDGMDQTSGVYPGDNTCMTGMELTGSVIDACVFLENVPFVGDTYRKMTVCVEDGDDLANDTYCPYITEMPTMDPTEATENPTTAAPTSNPTTAAPTEDVGDKAAGLYVLSLLMAVIGFVIYIE